VKGVKRKKLFLTCCSLIFIIACVHGPSFVPQRMGQLSVGMTKSDALKIMDVSPTAFRANLNKEYLIYETHWGDYFIRFTDGKVNAFGKLGDFGSPKDPGWFDSNVNMDVNINKTD
jgi:hypothetical protein